MHPATLIQLLNFDGLGWPITDSKRRRIQPLLLHWYASHTEQQNFIRI